MFSTRRMNIGLVALWGFVSFFYILVARVDACSPPNGWTYLSDGERAQKAGLVVYGTVVQSPRSGPSASFRHRERHYKALFKLHCVFKGPKLPQYINVSGFGYVPGLCTNSKAYLNRTYVVFLKGKTRSSSRGRFRVDDVNVQDGTIEVKTKAKLKEIIRSVGENSLLPIGTSKRSEPVCLRLRQCTELYRKRARKRNHKRRKCCRKNCPSRNTRAPQSTFLPTTLKETPELQFTDFLSHGGIGDAVPAYQIGESATSRAAGCFPKHWLHMLTFHGLIFVLITWQQT